MLFLSPSNLESSLVNLQQCLSSLRSWFFHNGLALNSDKTEVTCLGTAHRRQSLSSLTSVQVADASVSLSDHIKLLGITLDNRFSFDKHVSNVCSISYFHIFVTSALSLTSRVASLLHVLSSVPGLTTLIHAYMESPPTTSTDYSEFKIAPVSSNQPTRLLRHARYLPPFTGCQSVSESLSSSPVLSTVVCTAPSLRICLLSCTLILQRDHFILFRPPSRWTSSQNYPCFSWLPISRTTNLELSSKWHHTGSIFLLFQIQTQNLPLYFNSAITGCKANSTRLWFDVILDFARVINVLHYITMTYICSG